MWTCSWLKTFGCGIYFNQSCPADLEQTQQLADRLTGNSHETTGKTVQVSRCRLDTTETDLQLLRTTGHFSSPACARGLLSVLCAVLYKRCESHMPVSSNNCSELKEDACLNEWSVLLQLYVGSGDICLNLSDWKSLIKVRNQSDGQRRRVSRACNVFDNFGVIEQTFGNSRRA